MDSRDLDFESVEVRGAKTGRARRGTQTNAC